MAWCVGRQCAAAAAAAVCMSVLCLAVWPQQAVCGLDVARVPLTTDSENDLVQSEEWVKQRMRGAWNDFWGTLSSSVKNAGLHGATDADADADGDIADDRSDDPGYASDWGVGDSHGGLVEEVGADLKRTRRSSNPMRTLCIPVTAQLVEDHEGRHRCVYETERGHKAVGVAYDLDDVPDDRKTELSVVMADYDKLYRGGQCLNDFQITALLAIDVKRALDRVAGCVRNLDDICCDVQSALADVMFAVGESEFCSERFLNFREEVSAKDWQKAASALRCFDWCKDDRRSRRCEHDASIIHVGC
ncbi:hypothetical protein CBR_g48602 [Chara braunii]|uniref:Uncharacterized protein n=1 Tax=Chara braunii TaxID=69332 RepID=A0A388M3C5_CHABU|nr:hypothetical protein CBR_g48602 [Chara braunii]|eukprot:GBG88992.1 hypothetical protein CBR_g48602 [Chara braunii]